MEKVVRSSSGTVLCERCVVADRSLPRMRGLLGPEPEPGYGLWLRPAGSIHMFFMRFPIDALFLDHEDRVLRIAHSLKPWRLAAQRGAKSVLEVGAGECARLGVVEGETLELA